ncbi:MAG: hypothetical protein IJZ10_06145 [Thermoguttaceae bacterium]|nr:hypothetical protein [Thermoguttaceae bacterium]
MSIKELKEKYGVRGSVGAVNAAIRAEIPGGANVLDALTALHPALRRSNGRTRRDLEATFERLQSARAAMVDDVARRYGFKSRLQTEGGADDASQAERGA